MKTKTYRLKIVEYEDGGCSVSCPHMPGCVSQGDNLPEALRNYAEALEAWTEVTDEIREKRVDQTNE